MAQELAPLVTQRADEPGLEATAVKPGADGSIPTAFEQVAAKYPTRLAVCSDTWRATYDELNATANRIAHALIRRGGAPGDRIAVLMRHDAPQVAAVLGIVKAGRIVVTLNPSEAPARLVQVIEDATPALILTDDPRAAAAIAAETSAVLSYEDAIVDGPTSNPDIALDADATAHLVFTSGSTGRPKGVQQTHGQILHQTRGYTQATLLTCDDRLTLLGALTGGHGVGTMWTALLNGAALFPFVVADNSTVALVEWLTRHDITAYFSSVSLFRHLMKSLDDNVRFPTMRVVRLSSEAATAEDFRTFQRRFSGACSFVHTLASSEIGLIAYLRLSHRDVVAEGRIPVGRPVDGVEIGLIDDRGRPVARGHVGEIVARSHHVSSGYWRDDALTSKRYAQASNGEGQRIVHTGDLARFDANGMLEFLGRKDSRIKIRGYSVEPAEVESAILKAPGVDQSCVTAFTGPSGQPQLAAYVVLRSGYPHDVQSLRQVLRTRLPSYMLPSAFVFVDAFPLTAHGKIDRAGLLATHAPARSAHPGEQPRTETERLLAGIWEKALDMTGVGRNDDFFDLGGDSLIGAVVSAHVHAALGIELPISALSDHPVLADLARMIDESHASRLAPALPAARVADQGQLPLSFNQEAYWRLSQDPEFAAKHTMSHCSRIGGPLDRAILAGCIATIVQRHEMLRTSFSIVDGRPAQIVHPPPESPMIFHDLAGDPDARDKAMRIWKAEAAWSFDLNKPPLACFTLIRLSNDEHWLLSTHHHIVSDGWSWNIFFRELTRLYEARARGIEEQLPAPQQYADYTAWQHETMHPDGDRYREALAWWTDYILAASYPLQTAYRNAMMRCMRLVHPRQRLLKTLLGLFLRTVHAVPSPPRAKLPFERAAPMPGLDPSAGVLDWGIPNEVSKRLDDLARQGGASSYTVRLAAYVALLAAETKEPNVVVYTALSNRNRPATRDVFGFCASPTVIVVHCDGRQSFRQLVRTVRDRVRLLQTYADLPYDRVYQAMREWKIKMPQGTSILSAAWSHPDIHCAGIEITCMPSRAVNVMPAGFDVKFDFTYEHQSCQVLFDAGRYDADAVRDFVGRFQRLLDMLSRNPDLAIADALR